MTDARGFAVWLACNQFKHFVLQLVDTRSIWHSC